MDFFKKVGERYNVTGQGRSMTWGEMPPMEEFEKAFEEKLDGHFYWTLKGDDLRAVEEAGVDTDLNTTDAEELYDVVKTLSEHDMDTAGNLASNIMDMMGFDWV